MHILLICVFLSGIQPIEGFPIPIIYKSAKKIDYAVADEAVKIGIRYSDSARVKGPLELLACQGVIGRTADGESSVHLHGLMSNSEITVYGGHFLENGNPILATAEILIQESSDVRLVREQDEETGFLLFKFYSI